MPQATTAQRLAAAAAGHGVQSNVQALAILLDVLPPEATRHPNSRAFRTAAREHAAAHPSAPLVVPTRHEINAALRVLAGLGVLPSHVEHPSGSAARA